MILVIGGGIGGCATAAAAAGSRPTLIQRGHRLGGKGASHRTPSGRIIEHGLHVWPGYYDNAFALMRRAYGSTDGPPPGFFPAPAVGVANQLDWSPWLARFTANDKRPGIDHGSPTVQDFVRQCGELLRDLLSTGAEPVMAPGVYLSGRKEPRRTSTQSPIRLVTELTNTLLGASVTHLPRLMPSFPSASPAVDGMLDELKRAALELRPRSATGDDQVEQVIDLVVTCLIGVYRDDLLRRPEGFAAVDDEDFRDWLVRHGAQPSTIDCGVVRGMYDLVFGYRGGDHGRPAFEAGTGLTLASRFFFDFKGALFWKMKAGMGDVVFAPLYRHLKSLGVRFMFFHRLDELVLDESGRRVETVRLARQAELAPGVDEYEPLITMGGYEVFPERPLFDQLAVDTLPTDLEHHDGDRSTETMIELHHGDDFDQVILATSLGMVPHVAAQIIERDERWQAMVDNVATVATQALQLWSNRSAAELGWPHAGSTVAAYPSPFDTYAEMSHLVDIEATGDGTESVAYFCSVLDDVSAEAGPVAATDAAKRSAIDFLEGRAKHLWPNGRTGDGFDWDVLVGASEGSARLDEQFVTANTDASDRYVQSLPGSGKHRLRADDSGIDNLFLAGDWIDSGLNAGCIEAAAIAGIQAANAALGRPLCEGVRGGWQPVGPKTARAPDAEHTGD